MHSLAVSIDLTHHCWSSQRSKSVLWNSVLLDCGIADWMMKFFLWVIRSQ